MLASRSLLRRDGVEIADISCQHPRGRGEHGERTGCHAIVFVRRGCFVRSVEGVETTLDPTRAYCISPDEEQRYDHPHDGGDDCTALFLSGEVVESLCGGERCLPAGPISTEPKLDLEHRMLLAAARRGEDGHALFERSIRLAASTLGRRDPAPTFSGQPATGKARRTIVEGVRELLALDVDQSLPVLARELAVSPHHLSRIFNQATGHTISRHRLRVRIRSALNRLAAGDRDLARLALELGFADQSHLTRAVRSELGATPAVLRHALTQHPLDRASEAS